jgi:hypothetical protein
MPVSITWSVTEGPMRRVSRKRSTFAMERSRPARSQSFTVTFKAQSTGTPRIAAATASFNPDTNWRNNVALAAVTLTRS